jgi:hypothetical protein
MNSEHPLMVGQVKDPLSSDTIIHEYYQRIAAACDERNGEHC